MEHVIPTQVPFSFTQTLAFAWRFAPLEMAAVVDAERIVVAFASGGRAYTCELRERAGSVRLTLADDAPRSLVNRASALISAGDDLRPFYAVAAADPVMAPIALSLYGLHQVRFLGLEEIAVYCVMMQRASVASASAMKQRFLEAFGLPVAYEGRTLLAMPELADLAQLGVDEMAAAIHHRPKAERIATVVREVAQLGEEFLSHAPYAEARDALLAIPGVGPFSAVAILFRALGRADEVPSLEMFADAGRAIYGNAWDPEVLATRYRGVIGTWVYYLKTAAARSSMRPTPSRRAARRTLLRAA